MTNKPSVEKFFAQYEKLLGYDKGCEKGDFSCKVHGTIENGRMIVTRFEYEDNVGEGVRDIIAVLDDDGNVVAGKS